jgi:hypothetical protein
MNSTSSTTNVSNNCPIAKVFDNSSIEEAKALINAKLAEIKESEPKIRQELVSSYRYAMFTRFKIVPKLDVDSNTVDTSLEFESDQITSESLFGNEFHTFFVTKTFYQDASERKFLDPNGTLNEDSVDAVDTKVFDKSYVTYLKSERPHNDGHISTMAGPFADSCPLRDYYTGKDLTKQDCTCAKENSCKSAPISAQDASALLEPLKALVQQPFGDGKLKMINLAESKLPMFLLKDAIVTEARIKLPYGTPYSSENYSEYMDQRLSSLREGQKVQLSLSFLLSKQPKKVREQLESIIKESRNVATAVSKHLDIPMKSFDSIAGPDVKKHLVGGKWIPLKETVKLPDGSTKEQVVVKPKDIKFKIVITAYAPPSRDGKMSQIKHMTALSVDDVIRTTAHCVKVRDLVTLYKNRKVSGLL